MTSPSKLPSTLFETTPWHSEKPTIWMGTSLTLRRNLSRYNFPSKLQGGEVGQVLALLRKTLQQQPQLQGHFDFEETNLSPTDREALFEHFLLLKGFNHPLAGSASILDATGKLLARINSGNHLELHALANHNLDATWNLLSQLESGMEKMTPFAFSPKFGYLTSDPAECGTALTVSAFLHLPALIHTDKLNEALANIEDNALTFTGLTGDLEDLVGDILVLQNSYTVGVSEENILHTIATGATKLIGAEKTMRSHLKQETNTAVRDLISKAFGLLVHSFQLETKEALDLLSLMKLGLELGTITHISDQVLSDLFFTCRRGHLLHEFPQLKDAEEVNQTRAAVLQQKLSGIALTPELE